MRKLYKNVGMWLMLWIITYVLINSLVENNIVKFIYLSVFYVGYILYLLGDKETDSW